MQLGTKSIPLKHQVLFIAILSFLLYANTLKHGFVLDDYSVIKDNWVVQQGTEGIGTIFKTSYRYGYWNSEGTLYRPLTLTMFAIEWSISPDSPSIHHWVNVIAYSISIVLLLLFLYALFDKKDRIWIYLSVVLFAVHPIHTEVVANIKSRDEIMAFLFLLLGMWGYLKYHQQQKHIIGYAILGISYFIGLLFKESIVTFFVLFPILLWIKERNFSRSGITSIPMLSALLVFLFIRSKIIGSETSLDQTAELDNFLMGINDSADQLATTIKLLGVYLIKLIVPYPLANDYSIPHFSVSTWGDWKVWASIGAIVLPILLLIQKKIENKLIWTGYIILGGTLLLYSNLIIKIGSHFGERFLFIPSLGFCLILFGVAQVLAKRVKPTLLFGITIVVLLFTLLTFNRNKAWKDNFTLYETDVATHPNSARTHYYYGLGLMKDKALVTKNQQEKNRYLTLALNEFKQAITLYPYYSDAWANLGLASYRLNDKAKALHYYNEAIKFNPGNEMALSNRGTIYFEQANYPQAIESFKKAIQRNPRHTDALSNLAAVYGTIGEFQMSVNYFLEALKYDPNNKNNMRMLAMTYKSLGQTRNAQLWEAKARN